MGAERRFEPWPWIVALLLAAMVVGSLTFGWIAASHPDPRVVEHPLAAAAASPRAAE